MIRFEVFVRERAGLNGAGFESVFLKCAISSTAHTLALAHLHSASSLTLAHTHTRHTKFDTRPARVHHRGPLLSPRLVTLCLHADVTRGHARLGPHSRAVRTHTQHEEIHTAASAFDCNM